MNSQKCLDINNKIKKPPLKEYFCIHEEYIFLIKVLSRKIFRIIEDNSKIRQMQIVLLSRKWYTPCYYILINFILFYYISRFILKKKKMLVRHVINSRVNLTAKYARNNEFNTGTVASLYLPCCSNNQKEILQKYFKYNWKYTSKYKIKKSGIIIFCS